MAAHVRSAASPRSGIDCSFLVLVTGHAAAGKSTLAPRIAAELDAVWISRDAIHEMVYSGWSPRHPGTTERYDPEVGDCTFFEGGVVWRIFLWTVARVAAQVPVVADTPFNHEWNRAMFAETNRTIRVPVVEVALFGDRHVLLERAKKRAARPGIHQIKAKYSVQPDRYQEDYRPVLAAEQVVHIDTTDLASVDTAEIATSVLERVRRQRAAPGPRRPDLPAG